MTCKQNQGGVRMFIIRHGKYCLVALLSSLAMLLSYPSPLTAKEKITWMLVEWPPYVIQKGQFKDQGTVDQTVQLLINQLPGFEHEIIYSSAKRLFFDIKENKDSCTCSATWLKNAEREKIAIYSITLKNPIISPTRREPIEILRAAVTFIKK